MSSNLLPATGFVRIKVILGDPKASPPIPPVIPICKAAWWAGVRSGLYPPAIKLSANTTVWRAEDIHKLIADGKWSADEVVN